MPEASLVIKAEDRYSSVLKQLGSVTKSFSKDVDALERELTSLSQAKAPLTAALKDARKALSEAQKQFNETGDAVSRLQLEMAQANYDNIQRNLSAVTRTANQTAKQLEKVGKSGGTGGAALGIGAVINSIAAAGIGSMLGSVVQEGVGSIAGSALGSTGGSVVSSVLSSAIQGWAIGQIVPGIGTVVGTVAGAGVGLASSLLAEYGNRDSAFRSYYSSLYDTVSEQTDQSLSTGGTIAGSREQTRIAFAQRFGSEAAADAYLEQVKTMAQRTNYTYDEITGYSKNLLNSYAPEAVFGVLQSLSDATAALDLNSSDVDVLIKGLSRMRTTGKATQEYLNYFSERGLDVYAALSNATGWDKTSIAEHVTKGDISGETAAQAILDYINETFGGLSETLAGTYDAMTDNLEDIKANIDAALGEGYNQKRLDSIQADQDAYGGALGDAMAEMNVAIGEGRAMLDNLKDQYRREAMGALLLGSETTVFGASDAGALQELREAYIKANDEYVNGSTEAGLKMESLKEQAEALATTAYEASSAYQLAAEQELDQIAAIRDNTDAVAALTEYLKSQELSKGTAAKSALGTKADGTSWSVSEIMRDPTGYGRSIREANGYATGLERVPYNNFPAVLHEGERVLTAAQARSLDTGGGVQITMNGVTIREEADIDRVAQKLLDLLRLARLGGVSS